MLHFKPRWTYPYLALANVTGPSKWDKRPKPKQFMKSPHGKAGSPEITNTKGVPFPNLMECLHLTHAYKNRVLIRLKFITIFFCIITPFWELVANQTDQHPCRINLCQSELQQCKWWFIDATKENSIPFSVQGKEVENISHQLID